MRRNHATVKVVRLLLMLNDAELGIRALQPITQPAELQILNAGGSRDDLNVLDRLCQSKSIQLLDTSDAMVGEELLDVRVETA